VSWPSASVALENRDAADSLPSRPRRALPTRTGADLCDPQAQRLVFRSPTLHVAGKAAGECLQKVAMTRDSAGGRYRI
jgi:hypothetical protein